MIAALASKRVSYPGIDVAMLFMAAVVVKIHTKPIGQPSGFFCFRGCAVSIS